MDSVDHIETAPFSLELGPHVVNLTCECCGKPVKRVWGFVSKNQSAHAVYYSLLVEHDTRWIIHTLSIGNWWDDDAKDQRAWICLRAWNDGSAFPLQVLEPAESNHYPWESGGAALTRAQALSDPRIEDFYAVADFVNVNDPAVNSFLLGEGVNIKGRGCKHGEEIDYGGQQI
jgi:hypothetical protein